MTRATLFAVASALAIACAPTPASPTVAATPDASTTSASSDAESVQSAPIASDAAASAEEVADAEAAPEPASAAPAPMVTADAGEKTAGIIAPQRTGTGSRPASLEDALGSTPSGSHRTSAAAPAGDGPFDRSAAVTALRGVKLDACKTKGGPTGSARILLTFAPNGHVTKTEIEDPPYAGTETAKCIQAKFRAVRVPKFSGSAVPVKFPFRIGD